MISSTKSQKQKNNVQNLGAAPNDINDLEHEIKQIKQETQPENTEFTELKNDGNVQADKFYADQKEQSVECDNLKDAKHALRNGYSIIYKLSAKVSPLDIIKTAKELGLPTRKIKKVLGSSMVIKKLIDNYVNTKPNSGYLKHCTQVTALKCNDKLMPRIKIKMNLDYNKHVTQDNEFKSKFANELSHKIFNKCPNSKLNVVDVREGSVIVIVGFFAVFLAVYGLIQIHIDLSSRNVSNALNAVGEPQEFYNRQKVEVRKGDKSYPGTVVGLFVDKKEMDKVRIRYDGRKPSMWPWDTEEEFALNDTSLQAALEHEQQDPDIEGSLDINENGAVIEAKKKKKKLTTVYVV